MHHVALGEDARLGRREVRHAIGLHAHDEVEPVRGDVLDEGGVVDRGEGLEAPAVLLDGPVELALGELVGRLEHQVLEEMRVPDCPGRSVGRSDAIPEHLGDRGSAVVLDDDDRQAVVEREARAGRAPLRRRGRGAVEGAGGRGQARHGACCDRPPAGDDILHRAARPAKRNSCAPTPSYCPRRLRRSETKTACRCRPGRPSSRWTLPPGGRQVSCGCRRADSSIMNMLRKFR